MRVHHATFGDGRVIESRMHGNDEDLIVEFSRTVGTKHLVASFAHLVILKD